MEEVQHMKDDRIKKEDLKSVQSYQSAGSVQATIDESQQDDIEDPVAHTAIEEED